MESSLPIGAQPHIQPRVETALVAGLLAVFGMLAMGSLLPFLVTSIQQGSGTFPGAPPVSEGIMTLARNPTILVVVSLLPQLMLTTFALGGGWLSPQGWQQRLGLTSGTVPRRYWILFALSTPVVSILTGLLISLLTDHLSHRMQELSSLYGGYTGLFGLLVFSLPTLVPGLCEELLFRGYIQTRLLQAWKPWKAILVTSLLFSTAHINPVHAAGVLPLSLWLGVISMRCGCIWPAILGHTANNLFALMALLIAPQANTNPQVANALSLFFAVSACAWLASLFLLSSQLPATLSRES